MCLQVSAFAVRLGGAARAARVRRRGRESGHLLAHRGGGPGGHAAQDHDAPPRSRGAAPVLGAGVRNRAVIDDFGNLPTNHVILDGASLAYLSSPLGNALFDRGPCCFSFLVGSNEEAASSHRCSTCSHPRYAEAEARLVETAREDLDRALAAWPFSPQDPLLEVVRRAAPGGDVAARRHAALEAPRTHPQPTRKQHHGRRKDSVCRDTIG